VNNTWDDIRIIIKSDMFKSLSDVNGAPEPNSESERFIVGKSFNDDLIDIIDSDV